MSQVSHLPVPDADRHVVLEAHRDDVAAAGGEGNAGNPVLMGLDLRHLDSSHLDSSHLPDPHAGHVTALEQNTGVRGQDLVDLNLDHRETTGVLQELQSGQWTRGLKDGPGV